MAGIIVAVLLLWALGFQMLLLVASWSSPVDRAIALMAMGLLLIWVVLLGGLMWRYRAILVAAAMRLPLGWRTRFVLLATLLALLEEAVTTTMSNLAPWLGDKTGTAAITASTNYLEVVTGHSVVVFIPMFIAWAVLLSWRAFSPFAVMMLFGISGLLSEVIAFGGQNFWATGFWVLVYGLMVYLPACTVPARAVPPPRLWDWVTAVGLPILFATPIAFLLTRT